MDIKGAITGNFLGKDDLEGPENVTISDVTKEELPNETRPKVAVHFKEIDKPMIANKTNLRMLSHIFKSTNTKNWVGEKVTLYVDEDVSYGGKIVGGLRVRRFDAVAEGQTKLKDDDIPF